MSTSNRIFSLICTFATCDYIFPPPNAPINLPPTSDPSAGSLGISTSLGRVQGFYMNTIVGNVIGAFEGIPYAEPPVGDLRFRNPERKKPWDGTLAANKKRICIQMDPTRFYRVIGEEDCLYLNVYVPLERRKKSNFPVFIWVHGGSYFWGSGSYFGPSYFLDNDVILVTLNYRLGSLGFFSTADGQGNWGLKDQSMALTWVQENIRAFGGDPNRITMAGQSAGAASVQLHMMSPMSKGKFHGAISQSGSALAHWALPPNQTHLAQRLAKSLGCLPRASIDVVECMRRRQAKHVVSRQYNLFEFLENPPILFGPVVERNHPGAFLVNTPEEYYRKGLVANVPWITGVTRDEGDLFTMVNHLSPFGTRRTLRSLEASIPEILMYDKYDFNRTQNIKSFYLSQFPRPSFSGFETLLSLSQMVGDRFFYVPFDHSLKMHSKFVSAPMYAYYFTFKGKHGIPEKFNLRPADWGVMHTDELQYLFNNTEFFAPLARSDSDYIIARYFTELWSNFAATGEPLVIANEVEHRGWEAYSISNPKLLEINFNGGMVDEPHQKGIRFWNNI